MISKMTLLSAAAVIALNLPAIAHGFELDQQQTQKLINDMIKDLGGHDLIAKNNGKTMRCSYGGTRKVSIVRSGSLTNYTGDYRNCREKDSTRDGVYEIVLDGDEITNSESRRSINGELFDAAMQGDTSTAKKLIKTKADVNYTESIKKTEGGYIDEWTPLMSAVMAGSLDTVKLLVSNGAWVNYLNSMAVNSLWIAANKGNLEIVKYLAAHGAYINNSNIEDVTPLMAAALNGHLDVVKFLISAKAHIDSVHIDGDSALMFTLGQKHSDVASLLIDSGANVNIRNKSGLTALIIAAAEGNVEITGKLLEKKANTAITTNDGRTALDVARTRGLAGIVKLLEKATN